MSFQLTNEQSAIINAITDLTESGTYEEPNILAVQAVAGASKSTTLQLAAEKYKQINPTGRIRYLIFGKALADESRISFGINAMVSTIHAMAHNAIIKPFKLNSNIMPFIHWKDVPIKLPFNSLPVISKLIDDYCSSSALSLADFMLTYAEDIPSSYVPYASQLMDFMATGKMKPTHGLYLKMYHLLVMNGTIKPDPVDILMVDEFQDISSQVLDIIEHIPAKLKVFTGDQHQTIFQFLNLENGFARYPHATTLTLSKSFRVTKPLAVKIEQFMRSTVEPDFIFDGMDYPDNPEVNTEAYITRTNAELIGKMVELNQSNTPYRLAHKAKIDQMFKLPVTIITATPGGTTYSPELKYIQAAIDRWGKLPANSERPSKFKFLIQSFPDDQPLTEAIKLIVSHGPDTIMDAYNGAKLHKNSAGILLCTAHTSKGLTLDKVTLSSGMNDCVEDALYNITNKLTVSDEQYAELNLYYVAISRCRYELVNAKHIDRFH